MQQSELVVWTEVVARLYKHDSCAICHEAFSPAVDICRVLDCSHVFHAKCVDLWFIKATFCPLCKSDLKLTYRAHSSSQRSLGQYSQTSSHRSLGSRSQSSSLRSGQILVGHSNSDPALLRILQEHPGTLAALQHGRGSPPPGARGSSAGVLPAGGSDTPGGSPVPRGGLSPDRERSAASLGISFSDRSLPTAPAFEVMGSSYSERSIGLLSSSSSGALPAVQEASEEARADSQRSQSSNSPSAFSASPEAYHAGQEGALISPGAVQAGAGQRWQQQEWWQHQASCPSQHQATCPGHPPDTHETQQAVSQPSLPQFVSLASRVQPLISVTRGRHGSLHATPVVWPGAGGGSTASCIVVPPSTDSAASQGASSRSSSVPPEPPAAGLWVGPGGLAGQVASPGVPTLLQVAPGIPVVAGSGRHGYFTQFGIPATRGFTSPGGRATAMTAGVTATTMAVAAAAVATAHAAAQHQQQFVVSASMAPGARCLAGSARRRRGDTLASAWVRGLPGADDSHSEVAQDPYFSAQVGSRVGG